VFTEVYEVLYRAVEGISDLVTKPRLGLGAVLAPQRIKCGGVTA
jgi:hypothetical protein